MEAQSIGQAVADHIFAHTPGAAEAEAAVRVEIEPDSEFHRAVLVFPDGSRHRVPGVLTDPRQATTWGKSHLYAMRPTITMRAREAARSSSR
jgi:hypothetical protein